MKTLPLLTSSLACLLLCSCTFNRDWNRAVADYHAGAYKSPAGPWTGTWHTTTNDHTGNLRAIVTPSEEDPGSYDFRYHATWAKIFRGTYRVSYPVARRGGAHLVDGDHHMGIFGNFRHRARITRDDFTASYSNDKGEVGTFTMKRPE